ncbi:MAG: fatty acid desaturase [Chthonomonadales bacterium]|nr:fatty acid desaturase [Chthonomonadales bacterium]
MSVSPVELKTTVVQAAWYRELSKYEKSDTRKAIGQVLNTFVPYIGLWAAMIWIVRSHHSLWYLCPLIVVAAGLVVRIFIMQHDCGHGSFFKSHKANRFLGLICGVITFTPYDDWKHEHAAHHASAQDLERRGIGDIQTMTTEEYLNASPKQRLSYRLFRHPFVIFGFGPFFQFVAAHRFAHKRSGPRERQSVRITNFALLALVTLACLTIHWQTYLLIQAPIMAMAASLGVWLFYVQHQYDDVYWEHHENWDPIRAALEGSSYYKLPKILQWFSGNIGLHHIHHLRPRIPNYNLQKCYDEVPELQQSRTLTLFESLKCINLHLWDEQTRQMVSFRKLKLQMQSK